MVDGDLVELKQATIAWDMPPNSNPNVPSPQTNLGNLKAGELLIILRLGSYSSYCLTRFGPAFVDNTYFAWCLENLRTYRLFDK